MVVQDSAGMLSRQPTLSFYYLILLGVKTLPPKIDRLRVLYFLNNVDITPVHEALLGSRPCRRKAVEKFNAASRPRKINSSSINNSRGPRRPIYEVGRQWPSSGQRPGHQRSATTASMEDCLAGLWIEDSENDPNTTDIVLPGTEDSPTYGLSGSASASSATSVRKYDHRSPSSSSVDVGSDPSQMTSRSRRMAMACIRAT